jgi:NAD(P)-dependent dehydrogenase (short-subunit alcohol dehydrogenase family)
MSTLLVTGANRGIGLELCRQLKARGDTVLAACRASSRELDALGVRVEGGVDVATDDGVKTLAHRLEGTKLDVLVNNAGVLERDELGHLEMDKLRRQFEINSLGPLRVTQALLPNLHEGSKVVIVTSLMGSMADNGSGGFYGYRMSKAAVNAAGVSLARDLAPKKIAVMLVHPGMVKTDMTGHNGIEASESVRGILARIDALDLTKSGKFFHQAGRELPW